MEASFSNKSQVLPDFNEKREFVLLDFLKSNVKGIFGNVERANELTSDPPEIFLTSAQLEEKLQEEFEQKIGNGFKPKKFEIDHCVNFSNDGFSCVVCETGYETLGQGRHCHKI